MGTRASIPLQISDMLWNDDQFYRSIESGKKVNIPKFPRFDQWCDEDSFNLAFALAGFSYKDIDINVCNNIISISNVKSNKDDKINIQQGMICRGIARRSFNVGFLIHSNYDPLRSTAVMKDGLLNISIPRKESIDTVNINIRSE